MNGESEARRACSPTMVARRRRKPRWPCSGIGRGRRSGGSSRSAKQAGVPIPTKVNTHSERSRPPVPGQAVHRVRAKSSGLNGDP